MENYSQVCIWPGTLLGDSSVEEFENFFKDNFDVKVKYLEEVKTNGNEELCEEGGRNDLFFAVADEDVEKFAMPKFQIGARWLEDVVKYNDGTYLYDQEILDKYPPRW